MHHQSKLSKFIFVSIFVLGGLFLAANLGFQSAFAGRALPGTRVAGVNLSGKTYRQIKLAVSRGVHEPDLSLSINGHSVNVQASQIALEPQLNDVAEQATTPSDSWLPLVSLFKRQPILTLGYTADGAKLDSLLANLVSGVQLPATNASIAVSNGKVTVVPGKPGLGVTVDDAHHTITDALSVGADAVTINTQPIEPSITPTELEPIVKQMEAVMKLPITLTYQGKTFKPTPTVIGSWLGVNEEAGVPMLAVNSTQITAYLNQIGKGINQPAKNKLINTVNGAVQSTEEGTNGLAINQTSLIASISGALTSVKTLAVEIPTQVVAFKTVYNRTYNLDAPKYIEVNLSMQHMWVYQDHQVVMDTPITSGQTGNGHGTVQGLFAVYTKQRDRWLDGRPLGYNYNVFVQYWMPFYADYGLHDASWRSSFGGPDYYYHGSHGCVNMPIPAAAWLYGWVDVGTPVYVHT